MSEATLIPSGLLSRIQDKIRRRQYEFSKHALDQTLARAISVAELEAALLGEAEVLEIYPEDKYGPSCLILGFTLAERPLHTVCTYPERPYLKFITVYEPDPRYWENHRTRRIT